MLKLFSFIPWLKFLNTYTPIKYNKEKYDRYNIKEHINTLKQQLDSDGENVWDKQHGGSHYQKYKIQPSKFVVENEILYPEGCAIKYIVRHRDKNGKEDILKAIHFLEMILERDYSWLLNNKLLTRLLER